MTANRRLGSAARVMLFGMALLPIAPAFGESRVNKGAGTIGYLISPDDVVLIKENGSAIFPDALTMHSYFTCVGCTYDPAQIPTPTHWYQRAYLPTSAAAQAQADWGVARVRTYSGGQPPGESSGGPPAQSARTTPAPRRNGRKR